MTDLTLEEYRRFPPDEMGRKIRADAQKAFGLRDISHKTKRMASSSKVVSAFKTMLPFIRVKKSP